MIWIECEYCGGDYYAERSSRKYCSNSCKSMANRRRRREEEVVKNQIKYMNKKAEEMRQWRQQFEEERAKQQEIRILENLQKEIEKQKQMEIERQENAEKERLAKEVKEAEMLDKKFKQAAKEAENSMNAKLFELFAQIISNAALYIINQYFGGKGQGCSQEQKYASTSPSNDSSLKAD